MFPVAQGSREVAGPPTRLGDKRSHRGRARSRGVAGGPGGSRGGRGESRNVAAFPVRTLRGPPPQPCKSGSHCRINLLNLPNFSTTCETRTYNLAATLLDGDHSLQSGLTAEWQPHRPALDPALQLQLS